MVLSLVQLTEAVDDAREMKWGESFVAEILCQAFLKLYAAAVMQLKKGFLCFHHNICMVFNSRIVPLWCVI